MSLAICMDYTAVKLDTSKDQIIGTKLFDENIKETYYRHECAKGEAPPRGLYYHIVNMKEGLLFYQDIGADDAISNLSEGGLFIDDERLLELVMSEANEE